ncbi:helix-turn-helix transcriptional regulator [Aquincola sp. MAHUQ-54]|uniref:Helix-turn-helix transcriptional regulator n=1 Tax=Aquincola agrisoli TaxID=3119538 RepID=A0AAW9Q8R1_9BURK
MPRTPQRESPPAPHRAAQRRIGPLTPHLYTPTAERPVRAKRHRLTPEQFVVPHSHPWAQFVFSSTGVTRLTTAHGSYIVPPSRSVWVPPGVEHAVTVLSETDLFTLYFLQPSGRCGPQVPRAEEAPWRQCRVLEVSDLLRALVMSMDVVPDADGGPVPPPRETLQREARLSALILDELRRAQPIPLGVDLPADKRLRALCEAVIDDPTRHATLAGWARGTGASARTVARLFQQELGTSFGQWRQQVLLAKAVAMAAHRQPMKRIAADLGYASASAFTAMVRRSVGMPPARFFGYAL